MISAHLSTKVEALLERLGLSHADPTGFRFAVNVFIAASIVWFTLRPLGLTDAAWAIASMIAVSDPQPEQSRRFFHGRFINVLIGCCVGFCLLLAGIRSDWMVPSALALTVLISSYLVRVKTMWRQAPITAALVIAAGITSGSAQIGITRGLYKVSEVLFGCVVGVLVSWTTSKLWLIRQPS